jgi:RecB family exonuclease
MNAIFRALGINRQHEQDYINELVSIRREKEILLEFLDESLDHRSLAPVIEDLEERERAIKAALQEPELPPMPDAMRNPFTRRRTPEETEYIRQLIEKHGEKRAKPIVPVE